MERESEGKEEEKREGRVLDGEQEKEMERQITIWYKTESPSTGLQGLLAHLKLFTSSF